MRTVHESLSTMASPVHVELAGESLLVMLTLLLLTAQGCENVDALSQHEASLATFVPPREYSVALHPAECEIRYTSSESTRTCGQDLWFADQFKSYDVSPEKENCNN